MNDRVLAWLGGGAVLVGVSAGMLAGAGVAFAEEGSSSDDGGTTTSESSNTVESKDDSSDDASTPGESETNEPESTTDDGEAAEAVVVEKNDSDTAEANRATPSVTQFDSDDDGEDIDDAPAAEFVSSTSTPDPEVAVAQRKTSVIDTQDTQHVADTQDAQGAADFKDAAKSAAVAFAAASDEQAETTAAATPLQGLLSVIGTVVFNLYGMATSILGGPPILPPGSTVTVRTSTLHLDCGCDGDGVDVQADWYVPKTEEGQPPPDRLIYLQHGFLARGPWYSYTASALAEQTHSIVVAPSITSNFLAADACWLGATPMHEAMAGLFKDSNTALADSAKAAGYAGPIPDRVVLVGHSLGGGAVIGIAGAMADNHTEDRLAGVIMLDGVPLDPNAVESIKKVDAGIPIYDLASPRYFWNSFGVGVDALLEARPGKFVGVTLANGSHVDPMRGGNPLIQFGEELVAGFVRPENGDAAQMLMIDWANDMFAGVAHAPIADPFTIDTPSGPATAVPLPNDLTKQFFLNPLQRLMTLAGDFYTFEPACVEDSVAGCAASMAA